MRKVNELMDRVTSVFICSRNTVTSFERLKDMMLDISGVATRANFQEVIDDCEMSVLANAVASAADAIVAIANDESLPAPMRQQAAHCALKGSFASSMEMNAIMRQTTNQRAGYAHVRANGYDAAKAGKSWKDNPYDRGSYEYVEWERGWCQGDNRDPVTWRPMREIFAENRARAKA